MENIRAFLQFQTRGRAEALEVESGFFHEQICDVEIAERSHRPVRGGLDDDLPIRQGGRRDPEGSAHRPAPWPRGEPIEGGDFPVARVEKADLRQNGISLVDGAIRMQQAVGVITEFASVRTQVPRIGSNSGSAGNAEIEEFVKYCCSRHGQAVRRSRFD